MYLDSSLLLVGSQTAVGGTLATDVVAATGMNVLDYAATFSAGSISGGDMGPGEEFHIINLFQSPFIPSAGPASMQVVLQTCDYLNFSSELITEFPMTGLLDIVVPTAVAALSNGVMTVTTIGASATIQPGMHIFTGSLSAPVDTGITVVEQLTGTAGGSNGATFSVSSSTSTITPIVLANVWQGKQVGMRIPTSGMKRYMRLCYRTTGSGTFTQTAEAFITKNPQNVQYGASGFAVL